MKKRTLFGTRYSGGFNILGLSVGLTVFFSIKHGDKELEIQKKKEDKVKKLKEQIPLAITSLPFFKATRQRVAAKIGVNRTDRKFIQAFNELEVEKKIYKNRKKYFVCVNPSK